MIYFNNKEYNNNDIQKKIKKIFFTLSKKVNNFLYWFFIKKMIKESFGFKNEDKNFLNIKINLENVKKIIKEKYTNNISLISISDSPYKPLKIYFFMPFYFEEELKNSFDKNIFISISIERYIYILLLDIYYNILPKDESHYKIIKIYDLKQLRYPKSIIKIKKNCISENHEEKNNFFLISSYKENIALIININEKLNNSIEDRYIIKIQQTIKYDKGLYSSIEIEYNSLNYLLNFNINFSLWFYDEKNNQISNKEIYANKLKCDDYSKSKYIFGPLIKVKNKNLIIAQILSPFQRIEVYDLSKELCLDLKGYIELDKDNNYISRKNNNYLIYKDKFLLLASFNINLEKFNKFSDKNETKTIAGGIIILDIDKCEYINHIKFDDITSFNSIIKLNDNTLISSTTIIVRRRKTMYYRGKLILLNIEENNNKISLKRIEMNEYIGNCKYINCQNLIAESFILCSSEDNNDIWKLNKNNEFIHYFNL